MSVERLEELESKYSTITITSERDGVEYTEIDIRDLVFLIQYGFKQAERASELEEENKRYHEALEEIKLKTLDIKGNKDTRPFQIYGIASEVLEGETNE